MLRELAHPATRWGVNFLALLGVVLALYLGRLLFLPIVISLMLAAVLWPIVQLLHGRWYLPRPLAGVTAVAVLVALTCVGIFWVIWAMQQLVQDLQHTEDIYANIRQNVAAINTALADQVLPEKSEESVFFPQINRFLTEQKDLVPGYLRTAIAQILLILFLVLFLLIEGEMLIRRTAEVFGPSTGPDSRAARNALNEMARQVRSYLVWRTLINIGMAVFLGMVYQKVGLKQAWTWAILAGVLTYVPYIGPVIAGVPPAIDALVGPGPAMALTVIGIYSLVLFVEGYLIFPLILGRNMEINATTVMLACLFWGLVWGEIGLFLALPLMAAIKAICQHVPGWRPWANLMGTERPGRLRPGYGIAADASVDGAGLSQEEGAEAQKEAS